MDAQSPIEARPWPASRVARLVLPGLLLGALLELLAEPPVPGLHWLAGAASGQQLVLETPTGGLWHGEAGLGWHRPGFALQSLGRWRWSFAWSGWLPGWQLRSDDGPLSGHVHLSLGAGGVYFRDLELHFPADAIPPGMPSWDMLHAAGTLALTASDAALDGSGLSGHGTLAWRQARSSLVALETLGSWRAGWELRHGQGEYTLETETGPLHLEGRGHLVVPGHSSLRGRAWTEPGSAGVLEPLLRLIGHQGEDGSIPLEFP